MAANASISSVPKDDVVISIDFGTNNSAVHVRCGSEQSCVEAWPDGPDPASTVPSRVLYDRGKTEQEEIVKCGYEVDDTAVPLAFRWMKPMLSTDDRSILRQEVEGMVALSGRKEESVILDYLMFLCKAAGEQLRAETKGYPIHVVGAYPQQWDELGEKRYQRLLRSAARYVFGDNVRSVLIFPEILATARYLVPNEPGNYLMHVYDGGGSTTQYQMLFVHVATDGHITYENIHAPPCLPVGGEDFEVYYKSYIEREFGEADYAGGFRLLFQQIKFKQDPSRWSIGALKGQLPPGFEIDEAFTNAIAEHVHRPVDTKIVHWASTADGAATTKFEDMKGQLKRQVEGMMVSCNLEDTTSASCSSRRDAKIAAHQSRLSSMENYTSLRCMSGGQARNRRLIDGMRSHDRRWKTANGTRLAVCRGLTQLFDDNRTRAHSRLAYGFMGWQPCGRRYSPKDRARHLRKPRFDEDLARHVRWTFVPLIPQDEVIRLGFVREQPCAVTAAQGNPSWPDAVTICQAWYRSVHPHTEPDIQELFTMTFKEDPVPQEYITKRVYQADSETGRLEHNALEYHVQISVAFDRICGRVVTTNKEVISKGEWLLDDWKLNICDYLSSRRIKPKTPGTQRSESGLAN